MGQYHFVANLDKREFLNPHTMGDGLKLMEFGSSGDGTMLGLALLLACSNGRGGGDFHSKPEVPEDNDLIELIIGRWAGDRIAVIGDYSENDDFPRYRRNDPTMNPWADELKDETRTVWNDISLPVRRVIECDQYAGEHLRRRWDSPKEGENPYAILAVSAD
jgi:hypothetical protein